MNGGKVILRYLNIGKPIPCRNIYDKYENKIPGSATYIKLLLKLLMLN